MTSPTEYLQSIASSPKMRNCGWIAADELLAPLAGLDVASHAELIRVLPGLEKCQQIAAIRVFDILRVRSAGPALFECWLSDDSNVSFAAGQALQSVGSRKAYRRIIDHIWSKPTASNAKQACYILSHSLRIRSGDADLLEPLLAIFTSDRLPFNVRAQAAEGIAYDLSHVDRRTRRYHHALPILLQGLKDITPEVRFWTCFALGHARAKQALPELERMAAEDDAICPTWWRVKDEAADAICHILGKQAPERGPRLYGEAC